MTRFRWMVFVALSGGTLLQATGCDALLASLGSSIITSAINSFLSSLLTGV